MKITGKFILAAVMALIVLSVLSTIVSPAIVDYIHSREISFRHLENSLEFIVTYFVFGPPILTSGSVACLVFIIMKDRVGVQSSALIAFGSFVILSILLTILAVEMVVHGIMYIIESMGY